MLKVHFFSEVRLGYICFLFICFSFCFQILQARAVSMDSLCRLTYTFPSRYSLSAKEYAASIEARCHLQTHRSNVVTRWIRGLFTFERGDNEYETQSRMFLQHHANGAVDIKEIEFYSNLPRLRNTSDIIRQRFSLSLYSSQIFTDNILSPFNGQNRRYYTYELCYRFTEGGRECAHVEVRPRFRNTQLVEGIYDVDIGTGAVTNFDLSFYYDAMNIRVVGRVPRTGLACLFPYQLQIYLNLNLLGNRLKAKYDVSIKYDFSVNKAVSIASNKTFDLTHLYYLRVDTNCVNRLKNPLWRESSSVSLLTDTTKIDSNITVKKKRFSWSDMEDLFLDRHHISFGSNSLRLPAIITPEMFAWSHRKGLQVQTRLKISFNLRTKQQIVWFPKLSYSFKERKLYWRLPLDYSFLPVWEAHLRFEVGSGNYTYSKQQADYFRRQLEQNHAGSELINFPRNDIFTNYRDVYSKLYFSFQPKIGLKITTGLNFHRRCLVLNDVQLPWMKERLLSYFSKSLYSFAPHLRLEWTPALYYYRKEERKIPLYSKWPTFRLDYERGLHTKSFQCSYERYEVDVQYAHRLYALRTLFFRIGSGFFLDKSRQAFIDYDLFRDENILSDWADEMSGRFYLLGNHWYNDSPYYVKTSIAYESPMLLFSRLPGLTRYIEKERIYLNFVTLRSLSAYCELGYGIATPILDLSGFVSLGNHLKTGIGGRAVLHW